MRVAAVGDGSHAGLSLGTERFPIYHAPRSPGRVPPRPSQPWRRRGGSIECAALTRLAANGYRDAVFAAGLPWISAARSSTRGCCTPTASTVAISRFASARRPFLNSAQA